MAPLTTLLGHRPKSNWEVEKGEKIDSMAGMVEAADRKELERVNSALVFVLMPNTEGHLGLVSDH